MKKKVIKYEFLTPGFFKGVTAEEAAHELERIKEKYGELEAGCIVAESEREDSVLHQCFCWDNDRAAQLYREEQARALVRNIRVIVTNQDVEISVRAFVNVKTAPGSYRTYQPITEAIVNDDAYKDLLEQAKADMDGFVSKYAQIEELNSVKAEMLKVINNV